MKLCDPTLLFQSFHSCSKSVFPAPWHCTVNLENIRDVIKSHRQGVSLSPCYKKHSCCGASRMVLGWFFPHLSPQAVSHFPVAPIDRLLILRLCSPSPMLTQRREERQGPIPCEWEQQKWHLSWCQSCNTLPGLWLEAKANLSDLCSRSSGVLTGHRWKKSLPMRLSVTNPLFSQPSNRAALRLVFKKWGERATQRFLKGFSWLFVQGYSGNLIPSNCWNWNCYIATQAT